MSDAVKNQELMAIFYEETQGLITQMGQDLLILRVKQLTDDGEKDDTSTPCINTCSGKAQSEPSQPSVDMNRLRRSAHTIRSSAKIAGFNDLSEIARILERLFKTAEDGELEIDDDSIILLSIGAGTCQKILDGEAVNSAGLLWRLKQILGIKEEA